MRMTKERGDSMQAWPDYNKRALHQAVGPRQAVRVHEQRDERVEVAGDVRRLLQQEALHGALQARVPEARLVHAQRGVHLRREHRGVWSG